VEAMRQNFVMVDQEERRQVCWQQIQQVAAGLGGTVKEDEELLEEVTYLVEWPTALSGRFEEKYLKMPEELVVTPMREHQRYFPVYAKDGGLLPNFITVRNGDDYHLNVVAEGNEKVLRARLADAEFFYKDSSGAYASGGSKSITNRLLQTTITNKRVPPLPTTGPLDSWMQLLTLALGVLLLGGGFTLTLGRLVRKGHAR